jgi:cholesterol 7-dehydrogenase
VSPSSIYEEQRAATYPSPFPSGWYHLFDADELAPGEVRPLEVLGKHLVAFRGRRSKQIAVLDAHCPHQGAHLGDGSVRGDCLTCPFHRWSFANDGRLAAVPGLTKLPRARVTSYPIREHYGMVWMYHHVSGNRVEPPYEPETHADIDDGGLRYRDRHVVRDVNMHLSEFLENSVDFQHFDVVHKRLTIPWTRVELPGFGVEHDAGWELDATRPHVAILRDHAYITVFGRHQRWTGATARVTFFGPGGVSWFRFTVPRLGDIVLFQTNLPTEPMRQLVRFRWWADPRIPRPILWYIVGNWVSQWLADVAIWAKKIRRPKPVLVPLDGPVHELRRWMQQFY